MTTHKFSADNEQLMNLIVHAFYSKNEIFLRELLSNSSDACGKLRLLSLTQNKEVPSNLEIKLKVANDKLIIEDNGIGMTEEELINNLGTIASSGTKKFIEQFKTSEGSNQIGQFGVGFYSAFLVAEHVDVITKSPHCSTTHKWSSDGKGSFTVEDCDEELENNGTKIVLHIKEDSKEFLDVETLKKVIKQHSQFIDYPIKIQEFKTVSKLQESEQKVEDDEEEVKVEDEVENEVEEVKVEETEKEVTEEVWTQVNSQKPLWMRSETENSKDEYVSLYKTLSNDWEEYSTMNHFSLEGNVEFKSILYLPKRAPYDLFDSGKDRKVTRVKLYVKRVLIKENCEELVPEYLNFVVGVVDCVNLPLNVSREILQENKILNTIKKQVTKKSIQMIENLQEDKEKYTEFYKGFSKNIKLGVYQDKDNQVKLAKLLRFSCTLKDELVSLSEYIESLPQGTDKIYYLSGESLETIKGSPFLEYFDSKKIPVLLLTDAIDEYVMQQLNEFDGKKFVNVSKENIPLDDIKDTEVEKEFSDLCKYVKEVLEGKVAKVEVTKRLISTPCALSTSQHGWSANMQRIMKAQVLSDSQMASFMMGKKTLELSAVNPTILKLKDLLETNRANPTVKDLVWLLYETALLSSGFTLENPASFSKRITKIINLGLDINDDIEDSVEKEDSSVETLTEQVTSMEETD